MSWVEGDGAGWRQVHGLVIPIFFTMNIVLPAKKCMTVKKNKANTNCRFQINRFQINKSDNKSFAMIMTE